MHDTTTKIHNHLTSRSSVTNAVQSYSYTTKLLYRVACYRLLLIDMKCTSFRLKQWIMWNRIIVVYFLVLIKRSINYRTELVQFFIWVDFKFLVFPRIEACTYVLAEVLCRQHRLPWSYASLSLTWPLLTTSFLCRTSEVGFTSILIRSVHILEAGLWHFYFWRTRSAHTFDRFPQKSYYAVILEND
jgi:hypothetical protein